MKSIVKKVVDYPQNANVTHLQQSHFLKGTTGFNANHVSKNQSRPTHAAYAQIKHNHSPPFKQMIDQTVFLNYNTDILNISNHNGTEPNYCIYLTNSESF